MKIGFDTKPMKSGPKVFMNRLKRELVETNKFDLVNYDVWLNQAFKAIPSSVIKRRKRNRTKIVIRCDGRFNVDFTPNIFGRPMPLFYHIINYPLNRYFNRHIINNVYKSNIDHIIYQSKFSKQIVEKLKGYSPVANTIIMNGVDLRVFRPMNPKNNSNRDQFPRILMSHNFKPIKRVQQCPKIIAKLRKMYPKVLVTIVGENFRNSLEELKKEIAANRVERHFRIIGKIESNYLYEVYQKCHFLLHLSHQDSCPNAVIEAIACGLPVIYTNAGGTPEIVEGAGIGVNEDIDFTRTYVAHFSYKYVPQVDADDYVDAIRKLIQNLEFYRSEAENRRQEFSIKKVTEKYLGVAQSL
jgi:glycosyltransferase involved in cell wall biosynthesis